MAHFAEIDQSGTVLRVLVVNNSDCLDENGQESEATGAAFCASLFGGTWVQTSYNGRTRKNYAVIGGVYDAARDAFIAPKPFASWLLDDATAQWVAPVAYPNDGKTYDWDEAVGAWVEVI